MILIDDWYVLEMTSEQANKVLEIIKTAKKATSRNKVKILKIAKKRIFLKKRQLS